MRVSFKCTVRNIPMYFSEISNKVTNQGCRTVWKFEWASNNSREKEGFAFTLAKIWWGRAGGRRAGGRRALLPPLVPQFRRLYYSLTSPEVLPCHCLHVKRKGQFYAHFIPTFYRKSLFLVQMHYLFLKIGCTKWIKVRIDLHNTKNSVVYQIPLKYFFLWLLNKCRDWMTTFPRKTYEIGIYVK